MPCHSRSKRAWLSSPTLAFGKGKGLYRIIFHIREDDQQVLVLRLWHASRDAITAADMEE
jgi:plasmid stabilization system protein ParE